MTKMIKSFLFWHLPEICFGFVAGFSTIVFYI